MKAGSLLFFILLLAFPATAQNSLPVELLAGNNKVVADVLWFRPIKQKNSQEKTNWLFFNRSRAGVDYSNITSFAVTNAISYNFKNKLGLVWATQFLQTGFVSKLGLQYFTPFKNGSLFTWAVAGKNTYQHFSGDWFILARWQPPVNKKLKWFLQNELLVSGDEKQNSFFTQRTRIGWSKDITQFGLAADYSSNKTNILQVTETYGIFIRHEF